MLLKSMHILIASAGDTFSISFSFFFLSVSITLYSIHAHTSMGTQLWSFLHTILPHPGSVYSDCVLSVMYALKDLCQHTNKSIFMVTQGVRMLDD